MNKIKLNNLLSSGLVPTISKPTRIAEHSSSLIDNIFISRIDQLIYSHIIYDDISDHLPILAQISSRGPNNLNARTQMLKRNFSAKNHNKYFELLKSTNWYEIGLSNEIDTAYNEFSDRLISIVNTAFPYESKTQNKKSLMKPWITQSIARCCRRKSRLQKKYLANPTPVNRISYTTYRNQFKKTITIAEKQYYQNLLKQHVGHTRNTWKVLNEIINNSLHKSPITKMQIEGNITSDKQRL